MSIFSNLYENLLDELEEGNKVIWGEYNSDEQRKIDEWNRRIGVDNGLFSTVFRDKYFLSNLIDNCPDVEEQFKYAENTYKYCSGDNTFDDNYVIFTRRSVPSSKPKPEAFWTSEQVIVLNGLKNEIPVGSVQRLYSVIMVTTLAKLKDHGLSDHEGGGSDGEICIDPDKPFNDFLFTYKPEHEMAELREYQQNGGEELEEVLEGLRETAEMRKSAQGFKI